ncbi:Uma2 family endonuclease [Persephonella sp.]
MGVAEKYLPKYTLEDYRLWEGDWELIEGIPYAMAPSPYGSHQRILFEIGRTIANQLKNECNKNCYVYPELDWIISEDTVLRPDLSVLCKEIKQYIKEPPEIVVEVVSKSTSVKDEYLKFEIYQREKVPVYILAYPEIKKIRVFRLLDRKFDKYFDGDTGTVEIKLKNGCTVRINVAQLFE